VTIGRFTARVISRRELRFAGGADASADRSAHVRAGSGVATLAGALAVVQDDSNFIALVDPAAPGEARAITLPRGADGRRQFADATGNKGLKLDLEACFTVAGPAPLLIAMGSGSTPARESFVVVADAGSHAPQVRLVQASAFYALLHGAAAFAGAALNVEGAVPLGDVLRLFTRGNGASVGDVHPFNATCDVSLPALLAYLEHSATSTPPAPTRVRRVELGALDGVPLGFTDAVEAGGRILFTAAAESSPDTVRDGPVAGSVVGVIDEGDRVQWTPLTDDRGRPLREKVEGIAASGDDPSEWWLVADADDAARAAELWRVRLDGLAAP
jgi:hypothetical protein